MLDSAWRDDCLRIARATITTALDVIDEDVASLRRDNSLRHGLAGLGEILLTASELLGEQSYHERAIALARSLIDRHVSHGDWPSAVSSRGPNPSLMLGLAGVGYWLLRLHDPKAVPSLLLLVR